MASLVTYDKKGTPDCGKAIKVLEKAANGLDEDEPLTAKTIREAMSKKWIPLPDLPPAELVLKDAAEATGAVTRMIDHLDQLHSSLKALLPKEDAREVGRHFKIMHVWAEDLRLWLEKQQPKG